MSRSNGRELDSWSARRCLSRKRSVSACSQGEIENFVADVQNDERVHDLQFAQALGVGAWIGVPLPATLGRLYILCCLAREARGLTEQDVHVLRGVAATLGPQLDAPP